VPTDFIAPVSGASDVGKANVRLAHATKFTDRRSLTGFARGHAAGVNA